MSAADQIAAAVPHAAVLVSEDDRILAANALSAPLFGADIAGRHLITVIRQPSVLDAIEGCRHSRLPQETRYLTNDGQHDTTYRVRCAHLDLAELRGVLAVFEDTTDMQQADQMRRDFVANVSHELRTPLTALSGFIETLQGPARDDPAARDRFLGIMGREADRMNRLVKDLLSLSHVEAQERMRPNDPVDLADLLRATRRSLTQLAERNEVIFDEALPEEPVIISGDPDQLRQVFTNLIENAIKYGGRGCTVGLSVDGPAPGLGLRGDAVRATVSDDGPGIETLHIPRLTERFYRVDSHRSREMGGTGLGLAIVKHIINRHRGRMRIDSAPGQGSRFSVILPYDSGRSGRSGPPA
ncbi:ATP-binding protein [Lutimaribacter sp. EGI FJ00015]|uniref:ATP-binding protein n=1 Tax=Lutimaribacter degradans TaxID=2945989 RepID=A0ACC5ZRY6_9RHOB|nr:ATP-binding protein [Lutimaribacter sp. EGI FJ00013]MCM2561083.1 ATP-binding protein [Lutimaribacter sp. EGI FJ00013]MCO0611968.1 ATP-binding protein [Lutimaribacter sp. EGI FJ00015]MCO0634911.1 ATP-binding protein [Lutimaribacter sp. EGI FJ00014]